jgi:hypothetical protein
MRRLVTTLTFLLATSMVHAQEPARPAPAPAPRASAVSAGDAEALRGDLQRMKSLVQQMQTNLAYVTSIQGPLKHQFELEIEMWQLEIVRMERHLNSSVEKK